MRILDAEATGRDVKLPGDPPVSAEWSRAGQRVRAGYFMYFGAIGALMPFAALYYRDLGFDGLQVGMLTALPSLAAALLGPLWGAVSDALGIHRWVIRGALAIAAITAFATAQASAFLPILLLIGLLSFASVPIAPLLDSYGVTVSERSGRSYGSLRVWGSIGYMAAVLVVGWLMGDDVTSLLLVAHGVLVGFALLAVFRLPKLSERRTAPLLDGLKAIMQNRPAILLLLVAFLLSVGAAVISIYLGIRIQDIGGSASQVGLAFAVASGSELPVIAASAWLLNRLGAPRLVALAIVVYAVRFIAFSVITVPEWLLPFQALHGLSYGAFMMASVTLIHRLAGQQRAATAQALLTAVSMGFGSITGSLVGGALLDYIGTVGLFRIAAVLMAITLAVLLVGVRVVGLDREAANSTT